MDGKIDTIREALELAKSELGYHIAGIDASAKTWEALESISMALAILSTEPAQDEGKPEVGDACLFWKDTDSGIEYDVGLLSLHHNDQYYMRGGAGWKNCRILERAAKIQSIAGGVQP